MKEYTIVLYCYIMQSRVWPCSFVLNSSQIVNNINNVHRHGLGRVLTTIRSLDFIREYHPASSLPAIYGTLNSIKVVRDSPTGLSLLNSLYLYSV